MPETLEPTSISTSPLAPSTIKQNPLINKVGEPNWKNISLVLLALLILTMAITIGNELLTRELSKPTTNPIVPTLPPAATPNINKKRTIPTVTSKEACDQAGGQWFKDGLAAQYGCYFATSDPGKTCQDGSECEGECRDYKCSKFLNNPFGCYSVIEKGKVTQAICVD